MDRRTLLTGLLVSAGSIIAGIPSDSRIQEEEKVVLTSDKNNIYQSIIQKLRNIRINIYEEYSLERESERIVIFYPEIHGYDNLEKKIERINKVISVCSVKAIGLEGLYTIIDKDLGEKADAAEKKLREIRLGLFREYSTVTDLIKETLKNYIPIAEKEKLFTKLDDLLSRAGGDISFFKMSYEEQYITLAPGHLYLNKLINEVMLFPLETKKLDHQEMFKDALASLLLLEDEIKSFSEKLALNENNPTRRKLNEYNKNLRSILTNYCSNCMNETEEQLVKYEETALKKLPLEAEERNKNWCTRTIQVKPRYNIILVIGGAKHTSGFYDEIKQRTDYSMITINTGMKKNDLITK